MRFLFHICQLTYECMLTDNDHFKLSTVLSMCLMLTTALYIQHSYRIRLIMKYVHSTGLVILLCAVPLYQKSCYFFRSQSPVNVGR